MAGSGALEQIVLQYVHRQVALAIGVHVKNGGKDAFFEERLVFLGEVASDDPQVCSAGEPCRLTQGRSVGFPDCVETDDLAINFGSQIPYQLFLVAAILKELLPAR